MSLEALEDLEAATRKAYNAKRAKIEKEVSSQFGASSSTAASTSRRSIAAMKASMTAVGSFEWSVIGGYASSDARR